jgi:hypothetical protein
MITNHTIIITNISFFASPGHKEQGHCCHTIFKFLYIGVEGTPWKTFFLVNMKICPKVIMIFISNGVYSMDLIWPLNFLHTK